MTGRYSEPVDWAAAAWALAIWAAHFSALWGASSIWPDQPAARLAALAATVAAAAALAWLWRRRGIGPRSVPAVAIGLSAVSIAFGAMAAIVG